MRAPARVAASAVIAALWLGHAGRGLAGVPDWADEVASTAPAVGEGVSEETFRVLLTETRLEADSKGNLRMRLRTAKQALRSSSPEVGLGVFPFRSTAKVKTAKAWHLPPGERGGRNWGPTVELADLGSFASDRKARFIHVDGIKRGSLIFTEFEAVDVPFSFSRMVSFAQDAAIVLGRVELNAPKGWSVRSAWVHGAGPEAVVGDGAWRWEVHDLPAPIEEPMGPDPGESAPALVVSLIPPPGAGELAPAVLTDWPAVAAWYRGLIAGRDRVAPDRVPSSLRLAVREEEGVLARVAQAARSVRDGVRYLDVELGIGGYQPHYATDTLGNLYGDCKDKAMVLRALLANQGITAWPVVISATSASSVSAEVPALEAFDHLVNAVVLPRDLTVPGWARPATIDAGEAGRLMIVDSTSETLSPGCLPAHLSGRRALLVSEPAGQLLTLPEARPEWHRIERHFEGRVGADRSLTLEATSTFFGEPAALVRRDVRDSATKRRERVQGRLGRHWVDAASSGYGFEAETPEGLAKERTSWRVPVVPATGPDSFIPLFPGLAEDLPRVPTGRRRTAVVYPFPLTLRYETTLEGVPGPSVLPEGKQVLGNGWTIETTCTREGGRIVAGLTAVLTRTRFEPADLAELKKLWAALEAAADLSVTPGA